MRARITALLLTVFPPHAMRHVLSASKVRGMSVYRSNVPDSEKKDESGHPWPTTLEDVGRQHKN